MTRRIGVCSLAVLLLGGCAMGVRHNFDQRSLQLGVATSATVAVGTLDHRPYVLEGKKDPTFVGMSRGGFGNPFDVTTKSGNPLASDFTSAIVGSLEAAGVNAKGVELKHTLSQDQAAAALRVAGAQRSVLIRLVEWKSDAMVNTSLAYDLELRVLDAGGAVLLSKPQQGKEVLGSADVFTPGGASQVEPRFRRMLEVLFQAPDVVKALQP